jgi:hypothetical protein
MIVSAQIGAGSCLICISECRRIALTSGFADLVVDLSGWMRIENDAFSA